MTNEQLLTKFQAYLLTERRASPHTFDAYSRDVGQFLAFLGQKDRTVKEVVLADLKDFLAHLHESKVTARSAARKISALKSFFGYLTFQQVVSTNYAKQLVMPKIEKRLPEFLSEEEVELLFSLAEQDTTPMGVRNKLMMYVLYVTGIRVSELVSLQVCDIQFDSGFLKVAGKGGKERQVPIPTALLSMLTSYVETKHTAVGKAQADPHLFSCWYGKKMKPLTRQTCWSILKKLWKKAGVERNVWPHQLRHSFATHMLKKGANVRSLQMLLGHENLATVQTYTHLQTDYLRLIYNKKHPRS